MRGPRVTVNAAMLATAIGIQAGVETDVRTVVVRNSRLAVINDELCARQDIFLRVPILGRFKMNCPKPVRRIRQCPAMGGIDPPGNVPGIDVPFAHLNILT